LPADRHAEGRRLPRFVGQDDEGRLDAPGRDVPLRRPGRLPGAGVAVRGRRPADGRAAAEGGGRAGRAGEIADGGGAARVGGQAAAAAGGGGAAEVQDHRPDGRGRDTGGDGDGERVHAGGGLLGDGRPARPVHLEGDPPGVRGRGRGGDRGGGGDGGRNDAG